MIFEQNKTKFRENKKLMNEKRRNLKKKLNISRCRRRIYKTKTKKYILKKVNSAIFSMKLKWNNNPVSIVIPQKNLSTLMKK